MLNIDHLFGNLAKRKFLLFLLLIFPMFGFAQNNSAVVTWNTQVGCIEFGSEVDPIKEPSQPSSGVVFESLPRGQQCQKVCEESIVTYTLQGNNISTVSWSASGGSITSSSNSQAVVQWGSHGSGALQITITYTDNTQQTSSLCIEKINRPIAKFQLALGQDPKVCLNTTVYFDNLSNDNGGSSIVNYEWKVQGPGINQVFSNSFEPSYTFTQPGNYAISLTVTNSCNCTSQTFVMEITVEAGPPVDITCKSVVCEGSTEKYVANNPCGGKWEIVGGTIVTNNGNEIEVTWDQVDPNDGFGYVRYLSDCGCPAWTTIKIPVVLNEGKIQGDDGICIDKQSLYSLPQWPTTNFLWGITGPGNAEIIYTANRNEVYIKASIPGAYTLSSSYYNTLLGCSGQASKTIVIEKPVEIIGGLDEICAGTLQTFNSSPGVPVVWNITLNNSSVYPAPGTPPANFVTYAFPTPGTYIVTATKPGGCAGEPRIIKVTQAPPAPSGTITGSATVCAGVPYTYILSSVDAGMIPVWEVTNGVIQGSNTGVSISVVFNAGASPYIVKVRNRTSNALGCTSINATELAVNPIDLSSITVTAPQSTPFCPSSSGTFTINYNNIDPDTISWSFINPVNGNILPNFGSVLPGSTSNTVIVQFNEVSGVTLANLILTVVKCGQSHDVIVPVEILQTPTLTFINPGSICLGNNLTFQVNSSIANLGGFMQFTFSNGSQSPLLAYQQNGIYTFLNNNNINNNSLNPSGTITENVTVTYLVGVCPNYKATASISFTVFPKTQITITPGYNYVICDPNNYTPFTLYGNVSTGLTNSTNFQWFKDGLPISNPNPVISNYTVGGNTTSPYGIYYLQVTDGNGCVVKSQNISVNNDNCNIAPCTLPSGINPIMTANMTNVCNSATASLTGIGNPTSITWIAGPLMTLTGGQGTPNATFNVNIAGAHTAIAVLNYNGCTTSVSGTILKKYEPKLAIEVICDSSQSTYNVKVNNSSTIFNANTADITYTYTEVGSSTQYTGQGLQSATFNNLAPGTYTFSLKLSLPGQPNCIVTQTVTLEPIPDVAFVNPGTQFCVGTPIILTIPGYNTANSYEWLFDGTSYIPTNGTPIQITINHTWNGKIRLNATSPYGCDYFFERNVSIVKAEFLNDFLDPNPISVCENSVIPTISYVPGQQGLPNSFTWMNGSTAVAGAPTTGDFTPTESGSYWAVLTAANGCKDYGLATIPVSVVIKQKPYVNISGQANLCAGNSTILTGITTDLTLAHQWKDGAGNVLQAWNNTAPISFDTGILNAGTYTYRLEVGNPATGACTNYKDFVITVSNPPNAPVINYSINQCTPYQVSLSASGPANGTYLWSNGMMGQNINVSVGGAYQVTYIAPSGCTSEEQIMIPHSLESLMWIFPTGCFERCPRDGGYLIGPLGGYDGYEWIHNGNPVISGNGLIDPLWQPNLPGTYNLSISNGPCTFTSGAMNVSPNPDKCKVEGCKIDGYIKGIKEGNPYLIFGVLQNYNSTAITFSISSPNGYGTYVPSSVTIPPGGVYDFSINPLLFYPLAGFGGGSDVILFQNLTCKYELPVEFSQFENKSAIPKNKLEAITLSPNPAKEQVRINYNTGNEKMPAKMLMIHDAAGNVKFRKVINAYKGEITVPLDGWLQGVYIVSVITEEKALQSKLLKE